MGVDMAKYNSGADLLLWAIREAKFDYDNIQKLVKINIEGCEERIRKIEAMSQEEFMAYISRSIFGVANKDYYITDNKKRIEELKALPERIDHLLKMWRDEKSWFDWTLKNVYKGYVRQLKQAFEKLATNRFNSKLPSFSNG